MFLQALASMRDFKRLHEIALILIKYGFGGMVRRIGLAKALEKAGHVLPWGHTGEIVLLQPSARVRRMLEELGPTFIKFGQVLATRVDLFDPEWIHEFGKLLDSAPAVPYSEIRQQLMEDLGGAPEEVFAAFDEKPLAAASIAQVHRARLADGSEVVVKVRRPGIRSVIEADLRWLAKLAELAESESPELRAFRPREVVRQLAQSLRRELDFAGECRNAERLASSFSGYADEDAEPGRRSGPVIVIPKVYWQWVTERVCTQEFIIGIPGRNLAAVDEAGMDRKLLARRGARAVLKMIVEDGFFHADPHPGNVFYLPDNRIAFIDFGMMGRITEERREQLTRLLMGLVRGEPAQVAEVLVDWTGSGDIDETGLQWEIQAFVDQYHGVPLGQIHLSNMLGDLVEMLRQHKLALPVDLALLIKVFISLEGFGHEIDPEFDMVKESMPMLERVLRRRYAPDALMKRGWKVAGDALALFAGIPADLSRLLRAARRGRLEIHIDVTHLRRVGDQLDRSANRITMGIVVAALIIGSSIVMTVPGGPKLMGLPLFGFAGFLVAMFFGVWLLLSIWRSRRED